MHHPLPNLARAPRHRPARLAALFLLPLAFAGARALAAAEAPAAAAAPAAELPPFESVHGLPKHAGAYPALNLAWQCVANVQDANAVFPHPLIPGRALLATGAGLLLTEDQGQSWHPLPAGDVQRLGPVNGITFRPGQPDSFYVASKSRGVWLTTDNGRSFRQLGSKATGLAADNALALEPYLNDPAGRTLLVAHGDAAPGLSRSLDGGQSWAVLFPDWHVHAIFTAGANQNLFLAAAKASEPDAPRLFIMPTLTEPWQELGRDLTVTGFAVPRLRGEDWLLVATANRGILRVSRNAGVVRNIAPAGIDEWAGIGVTWGATADSQLVYAFEPTRLGMVILDPAGGGTAAAAENPPPPAAPAYQTASAGLLTCAIVREGAQLRANANGLVFYACLNSLLYRGERAAAAVRAVALTPPLSRFNLALEAEAFTRINARLRAFNATADLRAAAPPLQKAMAEQDAALASRRVTITALVDAAAAGQPPRQVTVDLSRLSLDARTPMAPAGAGLYTASFPVDIRYVQNRNEDWRQSWPSPIGLTVTAIAADGDLASGIGVLGIVERRTGGSPFVQPRGGGVGVEQGKLRGIGYESTVFRNGQKISGFGIDQPGPWRVAYYRGWGGETLDISSFQVLSFWIRFRKESTDELSLQLRDSPVFGHSTTTPPLPLIKGGFVPGGKFTGQFQHIIVPISRLIGNADGFQPAIVSALILSGTASQPVEYYLDQVALYTSAEAAAAEEENP
ncbi:MAG: hypothetical protein WC789_11335 [Lentisphaeria bacterium]|jgi:hypothetical protein